MDEQLVHRAHILAGQRRFQEAADILTGVIARNPDDHRSHAFFSEVCLDLNQKERSREMIDHAIGLSPQSSGYFYISARVHLANENFDDAEKALRHACELDPSDADNIGLWGHVKLARKQYQGALDLADRALALEPDHVLALNVRSSALLKLDFKEASFETIEGALEEDPNNAFTHSTYGWNLLEAGNHKKAAEHFSEALRSNPNLPMARHGMAESLKARNVVYRLFMKYYFFMNKLTAKYQWAIIIGLVVGIQFVDRIAQSNPSLAPILYPIVYLYVFVALSTWVLTPISNLFLRMDPYARHLLDKDEIRNSNLVGISAVVFLVGLLGMLFGDGIGWLGLTIYGFTMMLPLGNFFNSENPSYLMMAYAVAVGVIGIIALTAAFELNILNKFGNWYIFGIVGYTWISSFLGIQRNNE